MRKYSPGQMFWGCTLVRFASPKWVVTCHCGKEFKVDSYQLVAGHTRSCGCLRLAGLKARSTRHGQAGRGRKTAAYRVWRNMHTRCSNPHFRQFHRYGGRGITVCPEWADFAAFYADMGDPPIGHTLERVDNDAGYSRANCRWATRQEQARNTSRVRSITIDGVTRRLTEWAERLGMPHPSLLYWLGKYGDEEGVRRAAAKRNIELGEGPCQP